MSQNRDDLIVVLDIGSAWTRVLVAELNEGAPRYCGHGIVESAGMRKGLIAELGPASKAVKAASEQAERVARINIDQCVVGVGGPHIQGLNTNGGIELHTRMREIKAEDVQSVVRQARNIERPPDRNILHLLRRQFILDNYPGISNPVGMVGKRLEVDLHIATCSGSALQSTVTCANRAGLEVTEAVLETIGAAESTLTADERELGICLIDIGCHSTDLIVFYEGAVVHTASIRVGGQHFTNDLAIGLGMPVAQAEELKRLYGHAVVTDVPLDAEIEIANPQPQMLRLRKMADILEPRACELLQLIKKNLREGGVLEALGAGCVLTGGGAMLRGMLDITESQLRVPARTGLPVRLSNMPGELVHPSYSAAIGMILYTQRMRMNTATQSTTLRSKFRSVFAGSF
ncbi:MAG: cell division protein FtsA [Terracidiphilus sp.]|jgi:cell division protein FtsA